MLELLTQLPASNNENNQLQITNNRSQKNKKNNSEDALPCSFAMTVCLYPKTRQERGGIWT